MLLLNIENELKLAKNTVKPIFTTQKPQSL